MKSDFTSGIRFKLYIIILAAVLPALGIILYSGYAERLRELNKASTDAQLIAESLSSQINTISVSTRQMLITLSHYPDITKPDGPDQTRMLVSLLKDNRAYTNILVADSSGLVVASGTPTTGAIRLTDRKHFRDAVRDKDFAVGEFIRSRTTGESALPFSLPILDDRGALRAVVIGAVRLEILNDLLEFKGVPRNSVAEVLDHAGVRLLRYPADQTPNSAQRIGQRVEDGIWAQVLGAHDTGVFDLRGEDEVTRRYAFKKLRLRPDSDPYACVVAGLDVREAMEAASWSMYSNLAAMLLVTFAALLITHAGGNAMILRYLDQLVRVSRRLGQGDLTSRTGLGQVRGDIGDLARSFDEMASALENREGERSRIEQELVQSRELYRTVFAKVSDGMVLYGPDGEITDANLAALRMFGYECAGGLTCNAADLRLPIQTGGGQTAEAEANETDGRAVEIEAGRRDGSTFLAELRTTCFSYAGRSNCLALVRDVTERRMAEERFVALNRCFLEFGPDFRENIRSLTRLCGLFLHADASVYLVRHGEDFRVAAEWNLPPQAPRILTGKGSISAMILADNLDQPICLTGLQDSTYAETNPVIRDYDVSTYLGQVVRCSQQPIGVLCALYRTDQPCTDADKRFASILALAVGVEEERSLAMESLQASLTEKEILLKEIHHRVKNNLQIISSLLNLQSYYVQDAQVVEPLVESRNRVISMAMIHEELYRSRNLAGIDVVGYLRKLLDRVASSFGANRNITVSVTGEAPIFGIDRAIPVGLLVNELAANSFKHAFAGRSEGHIAVDVVHEVDTVRLSVTDDGIGLPTDFSLAAVQTLGMQLVSSLVQQLGGRIDVTRNQGAGFVISFPLTERLIGPVNGRNGDSGRAVVPS